ncbi:MAG TPA: class IV adenylate cyclase [Thermoanaerobaculia bacterium]|jgi:adenylate cyclase class 2|nr:class IV adenylate cyclase [Thermoanaerobaculia bacterium]
MRSKDNLEREVKFRGAELDKLRERLLELEAERVGPAAFEDNWILDRASELLSSGRILRLRTDGTRSRLTLKGPMRLEGNLKIREEREVGIENAEEAQALLENLGYQVVRRYQKVREEWQLGGVTIALDHTPIGDFAEFEGDGAETVAKRCGFDPQKAERRSYLRLYDDHLKKHPDSPPEMVFR